MNVARTMIRQSMMDRYSIKRIGWLRFISDSNYEVRKKTQLAIVNSKGKDTSSRILIKRCVYFEATNA